MHERERFRHEVCMHACPHSDKRPCVYLHTVCCISSEGCVHRSGLNAWVCQSQQQTISWGGKAPGLSPRRAPVAKKLVIDLRRGEGAWETKGKQGSTSVLFCPPVSHRTELWVFINSTVCPSQNEKPTVDEKVQSPTRTKIMLLEVEMKVIQTQYIAILENKSRSTDHYQL